MRRFIIALGIAALAMPGLYAGRLERRGLPQRQNMEQPRHERRVQDGDNAPIVTPVIKDPKGKVMYYSKESAGTFVFQGRMYLYEETFPAVVVKGTGDKVYFKNIISVFPADYYVEGSQEGNIITIPTNQTIEYDPETSTGFNFGVFRTVPFVENGEELVRFEYAPEVKSVTVEVSDEGAMKMVLPGEPFDGENPTEYVAGIYYLEDYEFTGYSDFFQDYTFLDITPTTIPEEAKVEPYVYIDEFNYAFIVDVAYYEDFLYIRGLSSMLPEAVLKAKIEGNKATIDQNEFLGIYFDQYYIFSKVVYDNPDYDPEDEDSSPFIMAPVNVGFELTVDREAGLITADTPGVYLSYHNDAEDFFNSLGYFGEFVLRYQESFGGVPSNPVQLEYTTEYAPYQGFNDFFFTLSNFSKEGGLLDVESVYYKVFVNGEPLIFNQSLVTNLLGEDVIAYQGVPYEVELIPYLFNNNEDIFKFSDNAFDVGIYTDNVHTIGVQTVYYYDNEFTYSDLVELNVETGEITEYPHVDSVAEVEADEPVATEYYTTDGRRLSQKPDRGIYLELTRYTNGIFRTSKVAK